MTQEHPITPPPELVDQWFDGDEYELATQAARWGADTELEACVKWLLDENYTGISFDLRSTRRPKPPSLKERALQALGHLDKGAEPQMDTTEAVDTIRRALESLPD